MPTSPIPMPGTYAAAVEFLSRDVVEAIERALPCPEAADGRHIWDENRDEVHAWGRLDTLVRVDRWWRCVYCLLTSTTDPIPVDCVGFQRHLMSEHYSMLTYGEAIR